MCELLDEKEFLPFFPMLKDPIKRNNYDLNGLNKKLDYKNIYNIFFQNDEINIFIGEFNIFDYLDKCK